MTYQYINDKVYIVTGAGHNPGIGSSIVQKLLLNGASVIANSRTFDEIWQEQLRHNAKVCMITGDVCEPDLQQYMIDHALSRWGRLDGLINNASTGAAELDDLGLPTRETWQDNFLLNCIAVYEFCVRCRPYFANAQGSIVKIASRAAIKAGAGNNIAYAASKSALVRVSQELALQFGPSVTVNCISPGLVASNRIRNIMQDNYDAFQTRWSAISNLASPISPEEIAETALFCLSSRSLTGQNIAVCGTAAM